MKNILSVFIGIVIFLNLSVQFGCGNSHPAEEGNMVDLKLREKIGLNIQSEEMLQLLKILGQPEISKHEVRPPGPAITNEDGTLDTTHGPDLGSPACSYYNFKDKGVSIFLNDKNIVGAFFLYNEGIEGFSQYQGKLPCDLKFTDTKKFLNEKFGPAEYRFNGLLDHPCEDNWGKSQGISITYSSGDSTDMSATISIVTVMEGDSINL